jgi:hypothetical protein
MTTQIDGEWLQYQLPTPIVVNYYQLAAYVSLPNARQPYSWALVASNDGSTWNTIDTQGAQSDVYWENKGSGPTHYRTYIIANNETAYQYYRFIITSTDPKSNPLGQITLYAFNLISGGTVDQAGFLESDSGGTVYPTETLTSASQNGYITSQSANWYVTQFSEPNTYQFFGLFRLSANRGQTFGAIDTTIYTSINYYINSFTSAPYASGYDPLYTAPTVPGEWLQLNLPLSIVPSYLQIASVYQESPYKAILLGSVDGTYWVPIISATDNQGDAYSGTTSYLTIRCETTDSYQYYRLSFPIGDYSNSNPFSIIAFQLISGGAVDSNGFLIDGSGGTVYPTETLASASQNGYATSQSTGFNTFLDADGNPVDGWYLLSVNASKQALGTIVNTRTSLSTYSLLYDDSGYYKGSTVSTVDYATTTTNYAPPPNPICFLEGSKILCYNLTTYKEEYRPIETLRKGMFVKTLHDGYKRIDLIGCSKLYNPGNSLRSKYRLYRCPKKNYPTLIDDLIITGCHSILVHTLTDQQREDVIEVQGATFVTDRLYRLPACVDHRSDPFEKEGLFTIWHLALEHSDPYVNYGIFANGLLVETTSKRMMLERSGMDLIE